MGVTDAIMKALMPSNAVESEEDRKKREARTLMLQKALQATPIQQEQGRYAKILEDAQK